MKKKYLLTSIVVLILVLLSFFIFKEKSITGNVVTWRSGCDSNYLESVWDEVFSVPANTSGYFNEITNSDGSTTCEISSYNLIGISLYVLTLTSNSYETREEINLSAYFSNLTLSGENAWAGVNKNNLAAINSFFENGNYNNWNPRSSTLPIENCANDFSETFKVKQNESSWTSDGDSGADMLYVNYSLFNSKWAVGTHSTGYVDGYKFLKIYSEKNLKVTNESFYKSMPVIQPATITVNKNENYTLLIASVVGGFQDFNVVLLNANQIGNITILFDKSGGKVELKPATNFSGVVPLNLTASNQYENVSVPISFKVLNVTGEELENNPPSLKKSFADVNIVKNTNYSLNISGYFNDSDGDALDYTSRVGANITVKITNMSLLLTPGTDFVGDSWMIVVADDGTDFKSSNKALVHVYSNQSQLQQELNNVSLTNTTNNNSEIVLLNISEEESNISDNGLVDVPESANKKLNKTVLFVAIGVLGFMFVALVVVLVVKRKEFFGGNVNVNSSVSPATIAPGYSNL